MIIISALQTVAFIPATISSWRCFIDFHDVGVASLFLSFGKVCVAIVLISFSKVGVAS